MVRQVIKIGSVIVLLTLAAAAITDTTFRRKQEPVVGAITTEDFVNVRQGTVQLVLFHSGGQTRETGSEVVRTSVGQSGLGTVATYGKNTFLLTHDHWGDLDTVIRAQILTADGQLVGEVAGDTFRDWVLYRDGGSLVLSIPVSLALTGGLRPAEIRAQTEVQIGDVLLVARQDPFAPGKVAFIRSTVVSLEPEAGLPAIHLRSLDGEPIVRGDSGGGIWLDGQVIGNNWKTDVLVGWGLASLRTGQPVERQRDTSVAARIPIQLVEALEILAVGPVEAGDLAKTDCLVQVDC